MLLQCCPCRLTMCTKVQKRTKIACDYRRRGSLEVAAKPHSDEDLPVKMIAIRPPQVPRRTRPHDAYKFHIIFQKTPLLLP
jgi:hypothetical protein